MSLRNLRNLVICVAALLVVAGLDQWILRVNATTAALYMLLVVLGAATKWGLRESIFTSLAGMLAFNYFFLPPVGTFTIADPENWAALFAFLVTAVTASTLSANGHRKAVEALTSRNQIARLYELSRALLMDEGEDAVRHSVMQAGQILDVAEIAFFDAAANRVYGAVREDVVSAAEMTRVAETGDSMVRQSIAVIPVRLGAHIIGSLTLVSPSMTPELRDSVANLLAINYERANALHRAAAAEVARRNEEFKSSLLDGLAHDLKTPLTAIRACVTHMIASPPRTEEVRLELLSIIDQESQRLQGTIIEAIELARIESRELHLEKEMVDISSLIEEIMTGIRDENRERYSVEGKAGTMISADRNLLRRALMQVVENAMKYGAPAGPINISFRREGGEAIISVMDRGPGFHPDELDRVFDKFYRGRRSRVRVEGTGMGLAITRGIIEAHGGKIEARNNTSGGAMILITLPAGGPTE